MKNIKVLIFQTLSGALIILFLSQTILNNIAKANETIEEKIILTNIKPLASIVLNIVDEDFKVSPIIDSNTSPHDYIIRPSDSKQLNDAAVLIIIDKQFDNSIYKASLRNSQLKKILLFDSNLISKRRRQILLEAGDDHAEEDEDEHDDDDEDNDIYDKHFWLSPSAVLQASDLITSSLAKLYPNKANKFSKNNDIFKQKIKAYQIKTSQKFKTKKLENYLTFHDSLQYFEYDFNLPISRAIHVEPQDILTINKITALREIIRDQNVACVYAEPQFNSKQILSIVRGYEIKLLEIDILASRLKTNKQLYLKLMNELADTILRCSK